ncbi:hypothetical protein PIB30_093936 [Stylosanthes scabra]|uniref:Uncharacterized protein n=1 Tax=Stylosanthes scabra TaxID=79078 RepID=A0ABU6ZUK9_9FABA|nr:hypothetical protein [Stylosanthes scabra]
MPRRQRGTLVRNRGYCPSPRWERYPTLLWILLDPIHLSDYREFVRICEHHLHSSTRVRPKGRPKKRLVSTLEKQIASASNKKKRKALVEVNVGDENSRTFE